MKSSQRELFKRTYYTRLIAAIVFCSLFASLLLWSALQMGIQITEKRFETSAETALIDLQQQINMNNGLIDSLVGWHHSQGTTHRSELRLFAQEMLHNYTHVRSIFYMPKVAEVRRHQFEQDMREEGYASYSIHKSVSGESPSIDTAPFYFPVTYIEPLVPKSAGLLGFDMNSQASIARALDYAIRRGEATYALSGDLLAESKGLFIIKAVYKGRIIPATEQGRLEQVDGVYIIAVLSKDLMASIISNIDIKNTTVKLNYLEGVNRWPVADYEPNTLSKLALFSTLNFRSSLQPFKQPFELELHRDLEIDDLKVGMMVSIILLCMLVIYLINLSLRRDLSLNISSELAKDAIYREKELAELTLHSIADGVICTDKYNRIEQMNEVAEVFCGWTLEQARSLFLSEVMVVLNENSGRHEIDLFSVEHIDKKGETNANLLLQSRDDKQYHIRVSAACIRDREQQYIGAIIVFHDVTNERKLTQLLAYQARHDELTGLYNRREFEVQLQQSLDKNRQKRANDVLCYVDLDQFKLVNDTCGHIAGDELLKQVTLILKTGLRPNDLVARLGGDEFGIIFRNFDLQQAFDVSTNLQNAIREHRFIWDNKIFDVGCSMGLVEIDADLGGIEALMIAADSTCYMAKDKGRNRIFLHTVDDHELQKRHGEMQWTHKIKCAFTESRFCLYRQMVKPLGDHAGPVHYEVLLRMYSGDGDIISPMAFIPAAERYNVMFEIDEWVIHHTLLAMRHDTSNEVHNINLSGKSINDERLLDYITNEINSSGVKPGRICFEITETAAIANLSLASEFIEELRKLGCKFALDDFGSGLSSFAYLKNLPVDFLKIDGVFVREMLKDKIDHAMVNSIIQVGHVMGIKTIAEYVESIEIERELVKLGADYGQGYAIHRPAPWCTVQGDQVKLLDTNGDVLRML